MSAVITGQIPNYPLNPLSKMANIEFLLYLMVNYWLNPKSTQEKSYYIMSTVINGQLPNEPKINIVK